MTMLSLNQVEFKYRKKEPCERGYSWIIRFSHCLNFGYHKYFFFFFFQFEIKMAVHAARTKKIICEATFQRSRRLKSQNFPLGLNHGHASRRH